MPETASARPSNLPGRWSTFALTATACVAVEAVLAAPGGCSPAAFGVAASLLVVAGIAASCVLERHWPGLGASARSAWTWVAITAPLAVAVETAVRAARGVPPLLDVLFMAFLRDTVVALALVAHHPVVRRACGGLSAFVVLVASAQAGDVRMQGFVALFAGIGTWWLLACHWESIQRPIAAGKRVALPRRWAAGLPLFGLLVPLLLPTSVMSMRSRGGFMPASGGERDASPQARGGIGDGDSLVRGLDDIRSFGPVEDAPFLNSHEPSLYDMFDDRYNEPEKVKTQRAVSLPFQQTPSAPEAHLAQSRRAGREFSTVRKPSRGSAKPVADLDSPAVFHLKGRVPLHLRLETFAEYDGIEWFAEAPPPQPPRASMETVAGRPWLRIGVSPAGNDHHAQPETHAVRVVSIDGNRIPVPNRLTAVHIDHVENDSLYRWEQPGILALDRDSIPDQLVIHLQSRVVDRRRLATSIPFLPPGREEYRQTGADERSVEVRRLAESWVEGVPRGIAQVERIVERLRNDYVLDADARVGGGDGHTVAEFLTVSRRGPDYLFASAAVCMIRSLGYAARLVGGFHASPRRYDARAGHTAVLPEDVHVWAEVLIGPDEWLTVEPSPGYAVLGPPLSLRERLLEAVALLGGWIGRHPLAASAAALALMLTWWCRVALVDAADTAAWMLCGGGEARAAILSTVALLDRRCRRAGLTRPAHVTPPRWLALVGERIPADHRRERGHEFLRLADEALYAPVFPAPVDACRHRSAAGVWSLRNLRAARIARPEHPAAFPPGDPR